MHRRLDRFGSARVPSFSASASSLLYGEPAFNRRSSGRSRQWIRSSKGTPHPEGVETIEATLNYIVNDGDKLFTETGGPGGLDRRSGGTSIRGRWSSTTAGHTCEEFALERDGFRFVRHDTKVADFFDEDEVRRVYYPEMEALVKAESGAARVVVFDHTLRTADDEMRETQRSARSCRACTTTTPNGRAAAGARYPARRSRRLLQRRFAIIQVWRPIRLPVECLPLAIGDAQPLARRPRHLRAPLSQPRRRDLRDHLQPGIDGSGSRACGRDEAIVFKVFDAMKDGRAR